MNVAITTTYNEAGSISDLVSGLNMPMIVVDAGSTDGTPDRAYDAGAHVIRLGNKLPIGPCLVMGWIEALSVFKNVERVVQIDAGGSHSFLDVRSMLASDADVVIGSRFVKGAKYIGNPTRAMLSRFAALACSFKTGRWFTDWTSGFRVFSARAIERLAVQSYEAKMHGWQIEVLHKALTLGLTVEESPITYIAGRSSFNRKVAVEAFNTWRNLDADRTWVNLSELG